MTDWATKTEAAEDVWLKRQEVAARLRVEVATLAKWACNNSGPKFSRIGKYAHYRLSDVVAWENAQPVGGERPTA